MKKKIVIVMVIVAVVAAFLLWRRYNAVDLNVDQGSGGGNPVDHTSLDYILTHITFNTPERNKIESVRQATETANTWRQDIAAKANRNGLSFDQQLVLDALWLLYTDPNGNATNDRLWELTAEVKSL